MSEWHVPESVAIAFATAPRTLDTGVAAAVEQHVVACPTCQAAIASAGVGLDLGAVWAEIEDEIDRRGADRLGWITKLTAESASARLIASTPALRLSAIAAVVLMVAAASLAASRLDASGVFLAVGPLVPVALVAISFAPGADPAGEAGLATPTYGLGLLARRLFAIGLVALGALSVGALAIPLDGPRALGWVLPSVALSAITIAGGVRWPTPRVGAVAATAWAIVIAAAARVEPDRAVTSSVLFDMTSQILFGVLAAAALAVVASKRDIVCQEVL